MGTLRSLPEIAMFVISGLKTTCSFAIEKSEAKAVLIFCLSAYGYFVVFA
jgi:hypothetical protein